MPTDIDVCLPFISSSLFENRYRIDKIEQSVWLICTLYCRLSGSVNTHRQTHKIWRRNNLPTYPQLPPINVYKINISESSHQPTFISSSVKTLHFICEESVELWVISCSLWRMKYELIKNNELSCVCLLHYKNCFEMRLVCRSTKLNSIIAFYAFIASVWAAAMQET